jgi:hypothetical protein
MTVFNNALAGAAGSGGADAYLINRSLRLDANTQAHLHRTPSTQGNRRQFTWSCWFKRSTLTGSSGEHKLWGNSVGNSAYTQLYFTNEDKLVWHIQTGYLITDRVFRDFAGWTHIVVQCNTDAAAGTARSKIWINGQQIPMFSGFSSYSWNSSTYQYNTTINDTSKHTYGGKQDYSNTHYFDGYIAETHFTDGHLYDADAFGKVDDDTGEWVPKAVSVTYGTNGYHLDFQDTSQVGKDVSGNGNHWTAANVGSGDIFPDSPTNDADNDVGNYATLNQNDSPNNLLGTLTNGALDFIGDTGNYSMLKSTIPYPNSGKWYFEAAFTGTAYSPRNVGSQHTAVGFCKTRETISSITDGNSTWIADSGYGTEFGSTRTDWHQAAIEGGTKVGVAIDRAANLAWFFVNGVRKRVVSLGSNGYLDLCPFGYSYNNTATGLSFNFGQQAFSHYPVHSDFVENASTHANHNATKLFDGLTTTYMSANGFNQTIYWKPYLTGVTSLRLYLTTGSRSEQIIIKGNLGSQTYTLPANTSAGWQSFSLTNVGSNVNEVEIYRGGAGEYIDVSMVEVNGTVLTDSGSSTGFKALQTANLPDPVIPDPATAFNAQTYTGTSGEKVITTGFNPDIVWVKNMSQLRWHRLVDSIRGVTKNLYPNDDDGESSNDTNNYKSFDATGYTLWGLDRDTNSADGDQYISWAWNGGDLVTNSAYDQSETWSSFWSATGNGIEAANPAANSFDGVLTGLGMRLNASSSCTWAPTGGYSYSGDFLIYACKDNDYTNTSWTVVHAGGTTDITSSVAAGTTMTELNLTNLGIQSPITSISFTSNNNGNPRVAGMKANGKILVDAGIVPVGSKNSVIYDRSQTWSNMITLGGSWHPGDNKYWMLNGELNNYGHAAANATATATFSSSFPKGVIELRIGRGGGNGGQLNVNGTNISATDAPNRKWYRINGNTLTSISVTNPSQNVGISGIRVNGKILADPASSSLFTGNNPAIDFPSIATKVTSYPEAGISIATYSGDGGYKSFAHGLDGKTPEMVIIKQRNNTDDWRVYFKHLNTDSPENRYLIWDKTNAMSTDQGRSIWDYQGPDAAVMHLGNDSAINSVGTNYVAYSFAPVSGFSEFGYYRKLSGQGFYNYCGFRPAWVMIRRTDTGNSWVIYDEARDPDNKAARRLYVEDINQDHSNTTHYIDILSSGFRIHSPSGNLLNTADTGGYYIWAAFASSPFKTARAR